MEKSELASYLNPRKLELILLPTENCNFRCTYCYEDFEIGQMKDNTVQAIKKFILNRLPKLTHLSISWFGGEPLMAKGVVLQLCEFAKAEAAAAGVRFSSSMTTNAFGLTRETFDALTAVNVRSYQISIDGDAEAHDQTRKLISGRGSFQRIWDNLRSLRSSTEKFAILLRLHIHSENIDSLHALLPKIHAEFGADPRFTVFLKPVGNWGGSSVKQMQLLKSPDEIVADLRAVLQNLGWFNNRTEAREITEVGAEDKRVTPCYAARSNSFVIRADGRLAKCTVAFNDERNVVGHINDDGTLHIVNQKMQGFMRGFQSMNEEELYCPMKGMPGEKEVKVIKFEKKPEPELAEVA